VATQAGAIDARGCKSVNYFRVSLYQEEAYATRTSSAKRDLEQGQITIVNRRTHDFQA